MPSISVTSPEVPLKNLFKMNMADYSTLLLLASNLLTIFLAVAQDWNVATIVWTYWSQSVIIGLFTSIRIFGLKKWTSGVASVEVNEKQIAPEQFGKMGAGLFFIFHYGLFHSVYLLFLVALFSNADFQGVILGSLIFFVNHLLSYLRSRRYLENTSLSLLRLAGIPYMRVIPMQFIIIFFAAMPLNTVALLSFLVLKTIADVLTHGIGLGILERASRSESSSM